MAERYVYLPAKKSGWIKAVLTEFEWNKGQAASQKTKNVLALHGAFRRRHPEAKILEISSKSYEDAGKKLSAFSLLKYVPELDKKVPVECVYQGGKVFEKGGPYKMLYEEKPKDAKRYCGLKNSGTLTNFYFDGKEIPLEPKNAFYNWLYINALLENPELAEEVLKYDAFTDIEFNPNNGVNCQAKAAALFVGLARDGLLEKCKNYEDFVELL